MTPEDDDPDERILLGHDIRAAVSDVIGGLRLIEDNVLPAGVRDQLGRIQSASELLARLVEELLVGTAVEEVGEVGNLNLHRFLDEELRRWHGAGEPTGTSVLLERNEALPEVVRLNGLHLRRVVSNVMGNALRHASGGTVTLAARITADGLLAIRVGDDGPGFPPDILPRLFRPATRGRDASGTGMGLHIAAAHAEALGGRIEARNRIKGGAEILLTIPPDIWQREPQTAPGLPDLSGRRILVADDSETSQIMVRAMLSQLGAECEVAADGIEALNWFARERFDLALIDIEMPALGGIDVLRSERLRQARGIAPPMSMVAMTGHVGREARDEIHDAGADGIIKKPLPGVERFGRRIARFLRAAPDASTWAPETAPALSAATLVELMIAAGPEFEGALLDRLRDDLASVDRDLTAAVEGGRLPDVLTQTHILLSLSGAVGALPTQEAARRLNRLARRGELEPVRIAGRLCLGRLADLRSDLDAAF